MGGILRRISIACSNCICRGWDEVWLCVHYCLTWLMASSWGSCFQYIHSPNATKYSIFCHWCSTDYRTTLKSFPPMYQSILLASQLIFDELKAPHLYQLHWWLPSATKRLWSSLFPRETSPCLLQHSCPVCSWTQSCTLLIPYITTNQQWRSSVRTSTNLWWDRGITHIASSTAFRPACQFCYMVM